MNRSFYKTLIVIGLMLVTASVFADDKRRRNRGNNDSQHGQKVLGVVNQLKRGNQSKVGHIINLVDEIKKHKAETAERPDDRVPVHPITTNSLTPSQGRPGYVWVIDHWERAKAPAGSNLQGLHGGAPPLAQGGVLVTGGGTLTNGAGTSNPPPPVNSPNSARDPSKGPAHGGVTVTTRPSGRNDVTGVGGSPFDELVQIFVIEGELNPLWRPDRDHRK